jgi:hypothetical protein
MRSFALGVALTALVVLLAGRDVFEAQEARAVDWRFARRGARATGLVNVDPFVANPDGILRRTPLAKNAQAASG